MNVEMSGLFYCDNCPHCKEYVSPQWMKIQGTRRTQEDVAIDYKLGIYSIGDNIECPFCNKNLYKNEESKMNEEWDYVRIPVTEDFLKLIFVEGLRAIKVHDGITDDYRFIYLIQDVKDGLYYIFFAKGNVPQGIHARTITPAYETLQ